MSIQSIQTAQHHNQAALAAALVSGEDTAAIRAEGERLAAQLQAAQKAEIEAERAAENADAVAIAKTVTVVIERTVDALQSSSSTTEFDRLIGKPMVAVDTSAELEFAAAQAARARIALERAEAAHEPHRVELLKLSERLQAKRAAIEVIKSRRAAGDEHPTDAADIAMLAADADALAQMVAAAQTKSDNSAPTAARAALKNAEASLLLAQNRAAFRVAKARVEQIEGAFVAAWSAMLDAGRAIGMGSPWTEYRASPEMTRAVTGQIVPGYRGAL